jgi:hypothetical protein
MTEQDRAILRVCANTSVQCYIGQIPLHPLTRKQIHGLKIHLMLIEEPKIWGEDAD